jgi:hypothetical protein
LPAANSPTASATFGRHRAVLRARHQALGAQHPTQLRDHPHHVGARDRDIEVEEALLDLFHQVRAAGLDRAGVHRRLLHIVAAERDHPLVLADALGQAHRAAEHLVRLLGVHPEVQAHLDRLVELGALELLDRARSPRLARARRSGIRAWFSRARLLSFVIAMPPLVHHRHAHGACGALDHEHRGFDLDGVQVRHLLFRDLLTWSRVIVPTRFVLGSPEPFSIPAASLISTDAGELLISNSNERSLKTVTTQPTFLPFRCPSPR